MSQRARDGRTPISPDKDLFHTLNDSYPAIWSNLVQFDFQQKHPGLFKDSPLHRESSTKRLHRGGKMLRHRGCLCLHRGWLCIAQGVVILQKSNPDQFHDHLTVIIRLTSGHFKGPL